jgi:hypothetical protein
MIACTAITLAVCIGGMWLADALSVRPAPRSPFPKNTRIR